MLIFEPGSYVVHAKLPELGSGEFVASENGRVRIRFASGERNFLWHLVSPHLTATDVAPVKPPKPEKAGRPARKRAPAAAKTPAAEKT